MHHTFDVLCSRKINYQIKVYNENLHAKHLPLLKQQVKLPQLRSRFAYESFRKQPRQTSRLAMENFSLHDNYSSELNETSTASPAVLIGQPRHLFIPVLNIFLSITASVGNALILVALHKETSLHPPTKLLFRCLAVTDLCVGLITQPLYAVAVMPRDTKINWVVLNYFITGNYVSSYMLCGVSSLTSTAISVDRLLALMLGLGYKQVVTLWRVRAVLISFWLIGVACGSMCLWSESATWIVAFVFLVLCLVTSIFSYSKIFLRLREHQTRVQSHVHPGQSSGEGITLNIDRYKRTVSSISWVQLTLIICYVPYGVVSLLWINGIRTDYPWLSTATLVYLSSSLNPILYCWKMKEVRQAAKDTLRQFCCRANRVVLHIHANSGANEVVSHII